MNYFQGYMMNFSNSYFCSLLDWFHNFNCSLLLGILVFVFLIMFFLFINSYYFKSCMIEYRFSEFMFSIFPTLILFMQMMPSLSLMFYGSTMYLDSSMTIKVIGHQWYWGYNYSDMGFSFDSYMKSVDSLSLGEFRLLEVDNRCVVPCNTNIRFCITSSDVIHSWALPCFGIKVDAMSGILSTLTYNFPMVGVFYGQCSEICGANHSFMPISLEVTLPVNFFNWCCSMID
uniref:Cytochrome c oxidase subunit 2 n=1 Tax=Strongyloides sp. EN-2020b TaxID=2725240 RepID=A0A6J4CTL9_9BILA|nr:cytochrome c oxidase subunit II [Strongyloides sp. EN-2020b]